MRISTEWFFAGLWKLFQLALSERGIKKFGVVVEDIDPEPDNPFLLLANHHHLTDPYFIGYRSRHPICYMANEAGFTGIKKYAAWLVRTFPKKKGQKDSQAMRRTFQLIAQGSNVGIFVEGDRSWDGETQPISPSIVKLVRKLKVPLRLINLCGNYLTQPRWAKAPRRGRITITGRTFTVEQIQQFSDEAIYQKICDALYSNEIKDPQLKQYPFTGAAFAEGIHFLLWLCPQCKSIDALSGTGHTIHCSGCQSQWELDGHLSFSPANAAGQDLKDWVEWQKGEVQTRVSAAEGDILLVQKNVFFLREQGQFLDWVRGDLSLDRHSLLFTAHDRSEKDFSLPVRDITYYVDNFNLTFDFGDKNQHYQMRFEGANAYKWILFLTEIQKAQNAPNSK